MSAVSPPSGDERSLRDADGTIVSASIIEACSVTRRFGAQTAVDRVDLTVAAGEVVGLLGANGAGKTTLIRLILGLLRPDAGRVLLFGADPSRESRRRLGYVPQGLGLWEDLTVAENLAFVISAFEAGPVELRDAQLEAARPDLVRDLPLGLRRRLAFAVARAHQPELLVLDEPTSGVDALARTHLWDTIRTAAEQGAGVLVTTHGMDEAEQCDRLIVMAQGRVVAQGTIETIIGDLTSVEVEGEHWETVFEALDAAGLPLALAGRRIRVPGVDLTRVRTALDARALDVSVTLVPATFEEAFVVLASTDIQERS